MTTVNIYLTFDGNCRKAFEFYQKVFGGEFPYVGTYGEMPARGGTPAVPDHLKDKIMHISLPISKETALMGSDAGGEWAPQVQQGNNFTISVNTDNTQEAERIFSELAEGGQVSMPLEKKFWESYFGMLTDQFGINWMVNCELPSHKKFEKENS